MPTDLALHIRETAVVDTHEHLWSEEAWVKNGSADVLADLFSPYARNDLVSAGADPEAVVRLGEPEGRDLATRFQAIEPAWRAMQFTSYGEAVRLTARHLYGIEELSAAALRDAQPKLDAFRSPGQRLHLLRHVANLDHVQVDDLAWACVPDASGPDFFLYDLRWRNFAAGQLELDRLEPTTGVTVRDLATLRRAMERLFELYGPVAIAVKTQHAYNRTLLWRERTDADAERALQIILKGGQADTDTLQCLGDWALARGVELAVQYNLPVKIHTGYFAGYNRMPLEWIKPANLCALLAKYPQARFVLMHTGYPYGEEMIAITKHYANAWADLCWAWSINSYATRGFVRSFLRAAPANKLFAFGGDTFAPTNSLAYALQMRHHVTRALQEEVDTGDLTERQAVELATRWLRGNQLACFDVETRRATIAGIRGSA